MKFHKDAFNEQEELSLQAELQTIFRLKEVSQSITSFSNVHMQPYYLQTKWEELPSDELLKGVAVLYKAGFTPMKVLADILINSHAELNELYLNFSQVMDCNYYKEDINDQKESSDTNRFSCLLRRRTSKTENSEARRKILKIRRKTPTVFDDVKCRKIIFEFERIVIRFPRIKKLTILLNSFSNHMLHLLGEQISHLKELTALSIGDLEEGKKRWGETNDIIKCVARSCKKFKELHLSNIIVDHNSLHILSKISYSHITTLAFKYCADITDFTLNQLVGDFQNIFNLYMSGCCPDLTGTGIASIHRCEYLKKLSLNRIGDGPTITEALQTILSFCMHLKDLHLSNYWNIDFKRLKVNPSLSLQILHLDECKELTDSGLESFIGSCSTHLRYLSISMCDGFSSEGLKSISLCKHLESLSLLKIQPFEMIAESIGNILSGCSKIETLIISQSQLSFEDRPLSRRSSYDEGMFQTKHIFLESIFRNGQHLQKIDLEHILLDIHLLRRLLSHCKHLQVLNICVCNMFYVNRLKATKDLNEQRTISRVKFNISEDCIFQFCSPVPLIMSEEAKKVFSMFRLEHLYSTPETQPLS